MINAVPGTYDEPRPTLRSLQTFAADEARYYRDDLEKLYTQAADVSGDLRYLLLWHLSQLERLCRELERLNQNGTQFSRPRLRRKIAEAVEAAHDHQQQATLLIRAGASRLSARIHRIQTTPPVPSYVYGL